MTSIIVTSDTVLSETKIPDYVIRRFGCHNCEYKSNEHICQIYREHQSEDVIQYPTHHICEYKKNEIFNYLPPYEQPPSPAQFMLDFKKGYATKIELEYKNRLRYAEEELNRLKFDKATPEEITRQESRVKQLYRRWKEMFDTLIRYEDKSVEREVSKKIDLTVEKKLSPIDIAKMVRDVEE